MFKRVCVLGVSVCGGGGVHVVGGYGLESMYPLPPLHPPPAPGISGTSVLRATTSQCQAYSLQPPFIWMFRIRSEPRRIAT